MPVKETVQRVTPVVVTLMFALSAQDVKPTCNHCSATYIPTDELQAYVQRAIANGLVDQQVRSVDIGKSQIGIGVVHRGKLDALAPKKPWPFPKRETPAFTAAFVPKVTVGIVVVASVLFGANAPVFTGVVVGPNPIA